MTNKILFSSDQSKLRISFMITCLSIIFFNNTLCSASDDQNIEANLVEILENIYSNKNENALKKAEKLTKTYPNFALGHLIMGDLLYSQFNSLERLGIDQLPGSKVTKLIEEAIARIRRHYRNDLSTLIPNYLLKITEKYPHILVIDTSSSTMFIYKNLGDNFEYVTNFYVSIGKKGVKKLREGDKKTPLGIYRVTREISATSLSDFYGAGAFPINYPNKWDQINGYGGYGIWLHGSPWSTYSRPPQASDGCIVLNNDDFKKLGEYIDTNGTPVIISEKIEWNTAGKNKIRMETLLTKVEKWKADWESLNTEKYLTNYSKLFTDGKRNFQDWAKRKKEINSRKKWIKVEITDLSITPYPSEKNLVAITFTQYYNSSNLNDRMSKIQYWSKDSDEWKIIYEGKN